jgi:rare lipoprotein A (peptidoglycan hydrolase)
LSCFESLHTRPFRFKQIQRNEEKFSDTLLGSMIRVTNLENGKSITVTVTDRGPNFRLHRILDLSEAAANELDYIQKGLTPVFVSPVVSYEPQHADLQSVLVEPRDELLVSSSTVQEDML